MSTVVVGGVRSILMAPTFFAVSLPALSATVADAESASPSPVIVSSPGAAVARPERASEAVQCTVTSPLYHPAALGADVTAPLSDGAVLSMSTSPTVSSPVLPATSVAVPVTDWSSPSLSVFGAEKVSTPDSSSPARKDTVTSSLYQPAALAGRSAEPLTVAGSVAVLPASSVAVPVTTCAAPSSATTLSGVHVAMPDRTSSHSNDTVTSDLFQPAAFAAGVSACEMVGEVPSILTSIALCVSSLPALSTLQYSSVCVPLPATATSVPLFATAPSSS